ncbi:hypothetical protein ACFP82_14460 [Cellulomonas gelida]|uniref:hypothetical protein n=1 Tax=Cellulomonas gelida TaxID=1712 RepID=UPI003615EF90
MPDGTVFFSLRTVRLQGCPRGANTGVKDVGGTDLAARPTHVSPVHQGHFTTSVVDAAFAELTMASPPYETATLYVPLPS